MPHTSKLHSSPQKTNVNIDSPSSASHRNKTLPYTSSTYTKRNRHTKLTKSEHSISRHATPHDILLPTSLQPSHSTLFSPPTPTLHSSKSTDNYLLHYNCTNSPQTQHNLLQQVIRIPLPNYHKPTHYKMRRQNSEDKTTSTNHPLTHTLHLTT